MSLLSALPPLLAVYRAGIAAILRQLGRRRCPPPAGTAKETVRFSEMPGAFMPSRDAVSWSEVEDTESNKDTY